MNKIVLIGGGSRNWTPTIVRDMMVNTALQGSEYVLHDPNLEACRLVKSICEKFAEKLDPTAKFTIEPGKARAFTGATAFLVTISTGGLDAMGHDLAIPEAYGIHHTVGDTSGPGGWARSLRNIPVFLQLAHDFNRYAPGALVMNYTNPMTVLTGVLARHCTGPVVGLCHGVFESLEFLQKLHRLEKESDLSVRYAGLNHFFWILDARSNDLDILADLKKRLRKQPLRDLFAANIKDAFGYHSEREVAAELYGQTGYLPYIGDRHTCEFFPQYITSKANMRAYRLKRTTIAQRRDYLRGRIAELKRWVKEGIPAKQFERSREAASDILAAWLTGGPFIDVGNVPNCGQIENLPRGVVVETPVRVDRTGFSPLSMGPLPRTILPLVEPWVHVFQETMEAGLESDRERALRALRVDPVCSHLTWPQVRELGEKLLTANGRYTRYLR